jgi:ketosteroid isomerase-like protein
MLMSDTDRNVEFIRDLYERYTMGDGPECVLDALADDVLWRSVGPPSRLPFARSRRGRDEVREYFRALTEDWEMISYKVNELIGQRDRVVALADVCFCHRETGKLVATAKADVFRLRDGRIIEFCEFFDSAAVVEAATDRSNAPPWPESALSGDTDL